MSNFKKIAAFALAIAFLPACENRREVLDLQHKTEEIHDAAMKEMAAMNRLARQLKKQEGGQAEHRDSLANALQQMDKAEEEMMNWMKNYHAPKNLPTEEAVKYLTEQKTSIETNLQNIQAAHEAGKKFAKQ